MPCLKGFIVDDIDDGADHTVWRLSEKVLLKVLNCKPWLYLKGSGSHPRGKGKTNSDRMHSSIQSRSGSDDTDRILWKKPDTELFQIPDEIRNSGYYVFSFHIVIGFYINTKIYTSFRF